MLTFRNPPRWLKPLDQIYAESLEQIVRAEELGFDTVWLTEHHFRSLTHRSTLGGVSQPVLLRAARLGVQGLCGRPGRRNWQMFREEMTARGRDPDAIRNVVIQYMYVAETDDQAWAEARDHGEYVRSHLHSWHAEVGSTVFPGPLQQDFIIGSPDSCIRRLESFLAASPVPVHHLVVEVQLAGIDHDKALRAMELLAKEVVPRFRVSGSDPESPVRAVSP